MKSTSQKNMGILEEPALLKDETPFINQEWERAS